MKEIQNTTKKYSVQNKGFISTSFLIVMMNILAIVLLKANYLTDSANVLSNIKDNWVFIKDEALIINYCKCELLLNHGLNDFSINGTSVFINENEGGYTLYFKKHSIDIEVFKKRIL